jgi:hypothetical protein
VNSLHEQHRFLHLFYLHVHDGDDEKSVFYEAYVQPVLCFCVCSGDGVTDVYDYPN